MLLDALAMALRVLPGLKLTHLPRLADFTRLAIAAAPAFGWKDADVLTAIANNRKAAVGTVIEADPLAVAVSDMGEWAGTATELLEKLNAIVPEKTQRERAWPKDAATVGTRLKRVTPALRQAGVTIVFDREGHAGSRKISISSATIDKSLSAPPAPSANAQKVDADGAADSNCAALSATKPLVSLEADGADGADSILSKAGVGPLPGGNADTKLTGADSAGVRNGPWEAEL